MSNLLPQVPEDDNRPMLLDPAPCTPWCAVDHATVLDDLTRSCQSAAPELPTLYASHTVNAVAARINDLTNGKLHPAEVWLNDEYMSAATARTLAGQLLVAADLAEALMRQ